MVGEKIRLLEKGDRGLTAAPCVRQRMDPGSLPGRALAIRKMQNIKRR